MRQVQIHYDRAAAAQVGLTLQQLSDVVETALSGRVVGQLTQVDGGTEDITVQLQATARNGLDAIGAIPVSTPTGQIISLRAVAQIEYGLGPSLVNRENVSRRIVVSANVAGRDLNRVVAEIQAQIAQQVELPSGYFIQYGGQFETEQRASHNLLLYSLLAAVAIAILMFLSVNSLPATVAIMLNLPLAMTFGNLDRRRALNGLPGWIHYPVWGGGAQWIVAGR